MDIEGAVDRLARRQVEEVDGGEPRLVGEVGGNGDRQPLRMGRTSSRVSGQTAQLAGLLDLLVYAVMISAVSQCRESEM